MKIVRHGLFKLVNEKPCLSVTWWYIFGAMLYLFFFLFWICLGVFLEKIRKEKSKPFSENVCVYYEV